MIPLSTNIAITSFSTCFFSLKSSCSSPLTAWICSRMPPSWLDVRCLSSRGLVRGGRWEAWDRETTHSIGQPFNLALSVAVFYDVLFCCVVVMAALWSGFVSTLVPLPSASIRDRQALTADAETVQLHGEFGSLRGRASVWPKKYGRKYHYLF